MDKIDRRLGMHHAISRRDFLDGAALVVGASLLSGCGRNNNDPTANIAEQYYPPAKTGMRGSHAGSFEAAHGAVEGQSWEAEPTDEHYDLVVVGAGISGLSSAHIYRRDVNPDARILILDNHDDFGGHAKRNEFTIDGRTHIGFGGTMFIDAPHAYPAVSKQVMRELGIEYARYDEFYQKDLYDSLGMGSCGFFDQENFGADYLSPGSSGFSASTKDAPLSDNAKAELERLFADKEDYLAGMTPAERRAVIESHSWRSYLETYAGLGDEVLTYIQKWGHGNWAAGADMLPAFLAWYEGYPGFAGMDLGSNEEEGDESRNEGDGEGEEEEAVRLFHFPDGNASVARLLVRKLVPDVAPGDTMEDVVGARFDYATLDRPENATRIRLNSTVVGLRHRDGPRSGKVDVTFVHDDKARTVTAEKVIWAGYHAMLPYVCDEIPEEQIAAFESSVRAPLVYTNVLIRNWKSLVKLGIRRAYCPGSFFHAVMVTFPVSIGDYQFPQSPEEPVILHLQHIPLAPGMSAPDQFRQGRQNLLQTPFETFERNVRDQLGRMLGPGGFDPAQDIAGITVNRWSHGYAFSVDQATKDVAWLPNTWWKHETKPWVEARQRIGNIAIAGTDASSNAMTESAIEEAHRAVHSLAT